MGENTAIASTAASTTKTPIRLKIVSRRRREFRVNRRVSARAARAATRSACVDRRCGDGGGSARAAVARAIGATGATGESDPTLARTCASLSLARTLAGRCEGSPGLPSFGLPSPDLPAALGCLRRPVAGGCDRGAGSNPSGLFTRAALQALQGSAERCDTRRHS
jgi:hypothetical protein